MTYRFGIGNLDVAPSPIDQMPLGEDSDLRIVVGETNEAESFALPSLGIFLYLWIAGTN